MLLTGLNSTGLPLPLYLCETGAELCKVTGITRGYREIGRLSTVYYLRLRNVAGVCSTYKDVKKSINLRLVSQYGYKGTKIL